MAIQSCKFGHPVGNEAGTVFQQQFVASRILRREMIPTKTGVFHSFWIPAFHSIIFAADVADTMLLRATM